MPTYEEAFMYAYMHADSVRSSYLGYSFHWVMANTELGYSETFFLYDICDHCVL